MAKRRHRSGGRTTPKGTRPGEPHDTGRATATRIELLLNDADEAAREIDDINEAEAWASAVQEAFRPVGLPPRPDTSPKAVLRAARTQGGSAGTVLAAAIAVYGPASARDQARKIAEHLISTGSGAPEWASRLGRVEPARAVMLNDIWGDGCSVYLDCVRDDETIGLGVSIDAIGGLVAHGFVYGPNTAKLEEFVADDPDTFVTEIDPADARATVEAGLAVADETLEFRDDDSEDVDPQLRALIEHRFSLLPAGGEPLLGIHDLNHKELIADFLARPGVTDLADIDDLADTFCNFADYCDGDPLRWSPARVETFLAVWVPAKVIADQEWYRNLPVGLREWLRYAADNRDLTERALQINLSTVDSAMGLMQENRLDPDKASPGSLIMSEMIADDIDITDQAATQAWIDQYNSRLQGPSVAP